MYIHKSARWRFTLAIILLTSLPPVTVCAESKARARDLGVPVDGTPE